MYSKAAFSKLPGLGGISSQRLRLAAGAGSLLAACEHHGLSVRTEGKQQQDKLLCSVSPQLPAGGKSFMRLRVALSPTHSLVRLLKFSRMTIKTHLGDYFPDTVNSAGL